jgi:integrase
MSEIIDVFEAYCRTRKLSPDTVQKRVEVVRRLAAFLGGTDLYRATPDDLAAFQGTFAHLASASIDIYSRHVASFYRWALAYGHIDKDPTGRMVDVKVRRGLPHPTSADDLRIIFACTKRPLRTCYVLAAFGGLRCGEITRLRWEDVDLRRGTAYIHGKGGKDRITPLLASVVDELERVGLAPRGPVVVRASGRPFSPNALSIASTKHLAELHVSTTLHSLRHAFATEAYRTTKDILLVRDLIGHTSVATTQIYTASSLDGASERLSSLSTAAADILDDGGNPSWLTTN